MRAALALLALTAPVAAQDLVYSNDATLACVNAAATAAARKACIGKSSDACMEATPGGSSTVGMSGCLSQELDFWDYALNENYRLSMEKAEKQDAGKSDYAPELAPSLREMQRAWIVYRDATCGFEADQWGGGTGQGPAGTSCLMRMTGEQALYLYDTWLSQ